MSVAVGVALLGGLPAGAAAVLPAFAPAMFLPRRPANTLLLLAPAELLGASGATGVAIATVAGAPDAGCSLVAFLLLITNKAIAAVGEPSALLLSATAVEPAVAIGSGRRTGICGAVSRVGGIESNPSPGERPCAGASSTACSPPRLRRWLRRVFGRSRISTGMSDGNGVRAVCGCA